MEKFLDFLYPVFRKFIPFELYRFLAVGGVCFVLNFAVFHLSYLYVFRYWHHASFFLQPHFYALLASMSVTILVGFYMNKKFVFKGAVLGVSIQFRRFAISSFVLVIASKLLLDLMVIVWGWNLTVSFIANTVLIQTVNFLFQKRISFHGADK